MKQILQSLKDGGIEVAEVPCPAVGRSHILIRSSRTLISAGTERTLIAFGKANFVNKARQQPDKVRMVWNKIKTDGFIPTFTSVVNKLDQPLQIGYCNAGVVAATGPGVIGFSPGDRVVSTGKHAEFVNVPAQLCAKIPEGVSDEEAAFTVIAAVGLQGIRLAQPTLGEVVVVVGLGLIGLITVQLLLAQGCRVLGLDYDSARLLQAKQYGAQVVDLSAGQDPLAAAEVFSRGRGVDAVIVTATAISSQPIHQAATMCRKRGRIILVGVTGLNLSRDDFYKKELIFQVSSSYGPGRYDTNYEEKGQDYPIGFVRWTAQRNFEAVLDMMSTHRLQVTSLITHRYNISDAREAYALISQPTHRSLGIILRYHDTGLGSDSSTIHLTDRNVVFGALGRVSLNFIGAGNYASAVLIPAFKHSGAALNSIACKSGVSGIYAARKFGFAEATTDVDRLFSDAKADAFVVTTPHSSHASLVIRALEAGKHVFVEKPLCLDLKELAAIRDAVRNFNGRKGSEVLKAPILMVGFNRRFAPQIKKIKNLLIGTTGPKAIVVTVNAGAIPPDHWIQDRQIGGGRILGEGCHFIDLIRFLVGEPISDCRRSSMNTPGHDTATLHLAFADGSIGSVHYFTNGHKAYPKETVQVFANGRVLKLDNYRKLTGYGWPSFKKMNLWKQDKGQKACAAAFVDAVKNGGVPPIPFEEIIEVAKTSIELA